MVTNKSLTALENSQMALTLTVDAASIEEAYKAKINKYAKEIQMKGFRKGKAPISVIESKFGSAIREESTFDLMESSLKETIETLDEKDKPLQFSTPVLQNEDKLAVILGTEGDGLLTETIDASDYVCKIPMREGVDSLNVAAAAAVIFWELRKR